MREQEQPFSKHQMCGQYTGDRSEQLRRDVERNVPPPEPAL